MDVHVTMFPFLLRRYLRVELLSHITNFSLTLKKVATSFHSAASIYKELHLHPHYHFHCCLFEYNYSSGLHWLSYYLHGNAVRNLFTYKMEDHKRSHMIFNLPYSLFLSSLSFTYIICYAAHIKVS